MLLNAMVARLNLPRGSAMDANGHFPAHLDGAPWRVQDAAEYLRVSSKHLRKLVAGGKVRSIRLGRRVLIPDVELRRVAAEGV